MISLANHPSLGKAGVNQLPLTLRRSRRNRLCTGSPWILHRRYCTPCRSFLRFQCPRNLGAGETGPLCQPMFARGELKSHLLSSPGRCRQAVLTAARQREHRQIHNTFIPESRAALAIRATPSLAPGQYPKDRNLRPTITTCSHKFLLQICLASLAYPVNPSSP